MIEMMTMQGSDDATLHLFGVSEQNKLLTTEAFSCNQTLKQKQIFECEGQKYILLYNIDMANFLFCKGINIEHSFTLLRRKYGKRNRTPKH